MRRSFPRGPVPPAAFQPALPPAAPAVAGLLIAGLLTAGPGGAQAQPQASAQDAHAVRVTRIAESQFRAGAGRITFAEVPVGTANPVYPPELYGGGAGSPTVRFGGYFRGRRMARREECPPGAVPTGCLAGTPSGPLTLDAGAPQTRTVNDSSRREQAPQLAGTPTFNGPVAIWFDSDQAAVGLDGGGFNAAGSVAITVYDRQGRELGRTANRGLGFEFLGLATADLSPRIAGLEFHLVGPEQAGFGVDNIRFGAPSQIDLPNATPPQPPQPPPQPTPPRRAPILP